LERDCDNSECRFGIKAKKAKNLMRIYGRTCSKRSTGVSMIQRILLEFIETCIGGQEGCTAQHHVECWGQRTSSVLSCDRVTKYRTPVDTSGAGGGFIFRSMYVAYAG